MADLALTAAQISAMDKDSAEIINGVLGGTVDLG